MKGDGKQAQQPGKGKKAAAPPPPTGSRPAMSARGQFRKGQPVNFAAEDNALQQRAQQVDDMHAIEAVVEEPYSGMSTAGSSQDPTIPTSSESAGIQWQKCPRCEKDIRVEFFNDHWSSHSSEIFPWLFLGGRRNAENEIELIERTKITHILNVAVELVNYLPLPLQNRFVEKTIPLNDTQDEKLLENGLRDAARYINDVHINDPENKNRILVHCTQGVSRSASTIIAYLMEYKHFRLNEAFYYLKDKRSIIDPRPNFIEELGRLETEILFHLQRQQMGGMPTLTAADVIGDRVFLNFDHNSKNDQVYQQRKQEITHAAAAKEEIKTQGLGGVKNFLGLGKKATSTSSSGGAGIIAGRPQLDGLGGETSSKDGKNISGAATTSPVAAPPMVVPPPGSSSATTTAGPLQTKASDAKTGRDLALRERIDKYKTVVEQTNKKNKLWVWEDIFGQLLDFETAMAVLHTIGDWMQRQLALRERKSHNRRLSQRQEQDDGGMSSSPNVSTSEVEQSEKVWSVLKPEVLIQELRHHAATCLAYCVLCEGIEDEKAKEALKDDIIQRLTKDEKSALGLTLSAEEDSRETTTAISWAEYTWKTYLRDGKVPQEGQKEYRKGHGPLPKGSFLGGKGKGGGFQPKPCGGALPADGSPRGGQPLVLPRRGPNTPSSRRISDTSIASSSVMKSTPKKPSEAEEFEKWRALPVMGSEEVQKRIRWEGLRATHKVYGGSGGIWLYNVDGKLVAGKFQRDAMEVYAILLSRCFHPSVLRFANMRVIHLLQEDEDGNGNEYFDLLSAVVQVKKKEAQIDTELPEEEAEAYTSSVNVQKMMSSGKQFLGILEVVRGLRTLQGVGGLHQVPQKHHDRILQQMGRMCAFDALINNFDRLPWRLIWSNDGNLQNLMIEQEGAPGNTNTLPQTKMSNNHDQEIPTRNKIEFDLIGIDQAITTILSEPGAAAYRERLKNACKEVLEDPSVRFSTMLHKFENITSSKNRNSVKSTSPILTPTTPMLKSKRKSTKEDAEIKAGLSATVQSHVSAPMNHQARKSNWRQDLQEQIYVCTGVAYDPKLIPFIAGLREGFEAIAGLDFEKALGECEKKIVQMFGGGVTRADLAPARAFLVANAEVIRKCVEELS
ncbi:unnamed protein product [Amoebophrya sp. A120]|nr:unnamed protein product [Amoebophrya sp. A120]|eukprot:GSA120T00023430001.1